MSNRNEYTPWVELGMTELDYWKAMYLDIQVQWAPVIEAAKALRQAERLPGTNERYFAVHEAKQAFNKAVEALEEVER